MKRPIPSLASTALPYIEYLREQGTVVEPAPEDPEKVESGVERTTAAMKAGRGAIVQAALSEDRWFGRADILLRVEEPSDLGAVLPSGHAEKAGRNSDEARGGDSLSLGRRGQGARPRTPIARASS